MINVDWLESKSREFNVDMRIWGASGPDLRRELESRVGVAFTDPISQFIENIGNVSLGHFQLIVGGDDEGQMSVATETESARKQDHFLHKGFLKIMDHAGESYFFDVGSNVVLAFDSMNTGEGMQTMEFPDFQKFIEWLFSEAKASSEDDRFKF